MAGLCGRRWVAVGLRSAAAVRLAEQVAVPANRAAAALAIDAKACTATKVAHETNGFVSHQALCSSREPWSHDGEAALTWASKLPTTELLVSSEQSISMVAQRRCDAGLTSEAIKGGVSRFSPEWIKVFSEAARQKDQPSIMGEFCRTRELKDDVKHPPVSLHL